MLNGDERAKAFLNIHYEYPDLIKKIEKLYIEAINEETSYVKIGLDDCLKIVGIFRRWIDREKELIEAKELNQYFLGILKEAYEAYHDEPGKQDKKARKALRILGFTTGKLTCPQF